MSLIDTVEPHASRLEGAADKLEAAGLGLHPENGHVAHLRRMAGHLRAAAALGRMPYEYDPHHRLEAAAASQDVFLPAPAAKVLRGADIRPPAPGQKMDRYDLDNRLEAAGVSVRDRLAAKIALERVGLLSA